MRDTVATPAAPKAIGPYSQAVRAGGFLYVSGQVGLDPVTGTLVEGGIVGETRRVMQNISAILEAAGASFDHVVRSTVFLASLDDFPAMNEVYGGFFSTPAPARATVEAARLPRNAKVEIDVVAWLGD